jgi:phosphatidylserine/phosphatidylglycerophosphate/cardiolipin synthase-like enzyme/uncharacterized membrane protein YdjX (TVP38/TMEM64 family)
VRRSRGTARAAAVEDSGEATRTALRKGVNCWRIEQAGRVGLLVDGEEYFDAFAAAAEKARDSLIILAWDFNSRTRLRCHDDPHAIPPPLLGDFLNYLVRHRRSLDVRVLIWDYPMIFGTDREFPSVYGLGWKPHRRIRVRYDNTHPVAGCHHQKVVVVDDALAFCGGLDLTCRRWDTHEHRPEDDRRCDDGSYPPFHDVMMMVDGDAARALGDLARERWARATGRRIASTRRSGDIWPAQVPVAMRDVDVAIARTRPGDAARAEIREIEALYLDMIRGARRSIYIENQYFTAHSVGEALAARLAEPAGPEIVVVLRRLSHGWLEELTMQNLRKALIGRLRAADVHGRLHVYYHDIEGLNEQHCIDVHSKVLIIDEEWLRVGSANVCNRSMGFDTECDLAIEARGRPDIGEAIAAFRNRLLGEHLGAEPARVGEAIRDRGSISGAIEALGGSQRSLVPLTHEPEAPDALMKIAGLADPEAPVKLEALIPQFAPHAPAQRSGLLWLKIASAAMLLVALTALWRVTPVAQWLDAEHMTDWARQFADKPWVLVFVIAAYTPACVLMFPRALITMFAVVAFGPWIGFTCAMTGILLAAFAAYAAGTRLDRSSVRRISGPQLSRIIRVLRQRGLVAMTALRLVPLAPFVVESVIAGAIRIRLFDFMAGTALGMLPGTLATTVFGDQLAAAIENPADVNVWLIAGVTAGLIAATLYVRRWLLTTAIHEPGRSVSHG